MYHLMENLWRTVRETKIEKWNQRVLDLLQDTRVLKDERKIHKILGKCAGAGFAIF